MESSPALVLAQLRQRTNQALADLTHARTTLKAEKRFLAAAQQDLADAEEAQKISQAVAQGIQQQAHQQITRLVSRCLAAVFDDPYEFNIAFEQKRGKTEARLFFTREGNEVDPMTASAGGAIDVAAFALRLAAMVLTRPAVRRFMFLDEPFRFVSPEPSNYRERVRDMLEMLQTELGIQFVIVTHMPEILTGKVIRLAKKPGGVVSYGRHSTPPVPQPGEE